MSTVAVPLPLRLARLVRLEHTVFALPFAYVGAFLAVDGWPGLATMAWITLAMVGARTLAMSLNRLIDAGIDARNPRTASRELPSGALTRAQVTGLCSVALAAYLVAVLQLDPLVRWLWPIPVVLFVVYPYLKRATWLCHLWLGASIGLAPVGAWVAVTGSLPWQAWTLGAAVCLWVAGSTSSTRCSTASTTSQRASTRGRPASVSPACSAAHAQCMPARWHCSWLPAWGCRWTRGTGSGSWSWRRCSPTSTRSSVRATCGRLDAAFFTVNGVSVDRVRGVRRARRARLTLVRLLDVPRGRWRLAELSHGGRRTSGTIPCTHATQVPR